MAISKQQAQENGLNVISTENTTQNHNTDVVEQLKEILPNIINADNQLDTKALQDVFNIANTTSNNQGYELTFAGKGIARHKATTPTDKELKYQPTQSKDTGDNADTENTIIRGDNIDVLKILKNNYYEKIKCIYIDPPYNTTSENFVYNDNFKVKEEKLIEEFGLNENTQNFLHNIYGTKSHSGWLSFMYPRLKLARDLLTEDGVIFISIDDNEQANLKILCDEIFGEINFVGGIIHQRAKGGGNAKNIVKGHDYILCYGKKLTKELTLKKEKVSSAKTIEENGENYIINDDVVRKVFGKYDKSLGDRRCFYEELIEYKGEAKKQEIDQKLEKGELFLQKNQDGMHMICKKELANKAFSKIYSIAKYLSEKGSEDLESLNINHFNNPKPVDLIKFLIKSILFDKDKNQNDIVLDFFSGSGTTAHAVMQLNAEDGGTRKCISVQWDEAIDESKPAYDFCINHNPKLEPVISSITIERINRAGDAIKAENPLLSDIDIGYRVFSLENRPDFSEDGGQTKMINPRDGIINTLYNMITATGQPLHTKIETITENALYKAGEQYYMVGNITAEQLSQYKDHPLNIDAYADIKLEDYLNLDIKNKENINIIF